MKAMVLAAGRGERMRPLTDTVAKPLLKAGGRSLIDYQLEKLAAADVQDVVINLSWMGESIRNTLGPVSYGMRLHYIDEGEVALDTGGGIHNALPMLGDEPFIVVNGDVYCEYEYAHLDLGDDDLAHLVLIENPPHHSTGDFALSDTRVSNDSERRCTFSGIGMYRAALFIDCDTGQFPLAPLLASAIDQGRVSGELYKGFWSDVGTTQRLADLDMRLRSQV
jgi:MurNAc alpha-1-phosphate uridylyltransferase